LSKDQFCELHNCFEDMYVAWLLKFSIVLKQSFYARYIDSRLIQFSTWTIS
jgi:hypothetical protein